jgi:hypothetical protein
MPPHPTTNERILDAVALIKPGTFFLSSQLRIKGGKDTCGSRKISSILKGRIRCPENPKGDLRYENGTWMKLEPINA